MPLHSHCRFHHQVNSQAALRRFIASDADIAEGDVLAGRLIGQPDAVLAIMAHPPETSSDLLFETWVDVVKANDRALKVDLKEAAVVPEIVGILTDREFNQDALIINADVVVGPGGKRAMLSIDDLKTCRAAFPECIISAGATTGAGGKSYTNAHVEELVSAIHQIGGSVTVPLRAECVLADPTVVKRLVGAGGHITFWTGPSTFPSTAKTIAILRDLSKDAFIDLPDDADGQPAQA